ncbi:MAG: OsmC family protein [Kiritimatiellia bacterium]|nr:OsmC family protein [Kiritimatiellia bacterium]MDP6847677.1 OsmC family protein [Kiritimatiellia bacterium]
MVEIDISYDGNLRCTAKHAPSSGTLITDAPTDNQGKGETFSPTDLVATALGSCALTIMGIVAERHGIDISGATAHAEKEMSTDKPRRIVKLPVTVRIPRELSPEEKTRIERGALHCPVHKSIHPEIDAPITFVYGE